MSGSSQSVNSDHAGMVRIQATEDTFKMLVDRILGMEVLTEAQADRREALVNSAKSYVDAQIRQGIQGYVPLEAYMEGQELYVQRAKWQTVRDWLCHNLDVYNLKKTGRLTY